VIREISAELVRRLRALTLTLLPLEVDPDCINDPTSRVVTPQVISAYTAAGGDFVEAVSTCWNDAYFRIDTYGIASILLAESKSRVYVGCEPQSCRLRGELWPRLIPQFLCTDLMHLNCVCQLGILCEVLARRIVHLAPPDRLHSIMSTRFRHKQINGEMSEMSSALEMAIDSHWYGITYLV
jgi:hypothetical protein